VSRSAPRPLAAQAFQSRLVAADQLSDDGGRLLLDGTIASGPGGRFQLVVPAALDGSPSGSLRIRTAAGTTCAGSVTDLRPGQVVAACTDETGMSWTVGMRLERASDGSIAGVMVAQPGDGSTL
jgi:hypothetical protein